MRTVAYIGNLMQVPEYLAHDGNFRLVAAIHEAGKLGDDLLTFSEVRGVPLHVAATPEDLVRLATKIKADVYVMCGFGLKVPEEMIAKHDVYNIHPSPLPHYRGRHPLFWATVRGEKTLGITLHAVAEKIDAGAIVSQAAIPYYLWMSEPEALAALLEKVPDLLAGLHQFLKGKKKARRSVGGHYDKPAQEADYTIDLLKDPPALIINKIRAQKRYKGAKLVTGGRTLWIKAARLTRGAGPDCVACTNGLSLRLLDYVQE